VKKTRKIRYEHLCFHAQQAAEKSIKALLLSRNIEVPRTGNEHYGKRKQSLTGKILNCRIFHFHTVHNFPQYIS
jgi:hypothetical protein